MKYQSLFPYVVALALTITLFGKGLVAVAMTVCLVMAVPIVWAHKGRIRPLSLKAKRDLLLMGMVICGWLLSGLMGLNPDKALSHWARFSGIMMGGAFLYMGLKYTDFSFDRFYKAVYLCTAVAAIIIVVNGVVPFLPDGLIRSFYGSVLVMTVPFVLKEVIMTRSWVGGVIMMLVVASIFAVGGRTAWVAMFVTLGVFFAVFPWKKSPFRIGSHVILLTSIVISATAGMGLYAKTVGEHIFAARVSQIDLERPASGRLEIWGEALKTVAENPFLGVGIKGFRELDLSMQPLHAHNVVLEIIIDTGFLGLALLSIMVLVWLYDFIHAYRASTHCGEKINAIPVFVSLMAYGVSCLALTSIFHAWWFLYGVVLLIVLKLATDRLKSQSQA